MIGVVAQSPWRQDGAERKMDREDQILDLFNFFRKY